MRVVQVANFSESAFGWPANGGGSSGCGVLRPGPRSLPGGTRTVSPSGHELPSGVVRISLPARLIPFTGGYRAVLPGGDRTAGPAVHLTPSRSLTASPLDLSASGAGPRDVATVMISHERLDRLVGQILPPRAARSIADAANRRTAQSYDAVVCTTAFAREEFDRIDATNVVTVPLGVDLDQFHPSRRSTSVRQQWASPEQTLLVHCGRLSVEKHAHRSVDTVASLRDSGVDARLVVVGEGPMRARLERRRPPACPSTSPATSDVVTRSPRSWRQPDVALAPGPHETFGLAALEALACGTPAVVSRTSALAEILTTDSGAAADNDPLRHRAGGDLHHQPARTIAAQRRTPPRRTVHLASRGHGHAERAGRRLGRGRGGGLGSGYR